ncbi:unnamed protein product [Lactuca saligna]|uniref:Uncharacterized protein n=1 Tax=Lactuca saligna TaxID=75948 RepID=A0AA35ZQQ5_LACSI|nr:unnamed protein product [Lactuca saligna]
MHERRNYRERIPGDVMAFSDAPPLSSPASPSANAANVARVVKCRHLLCIRRGETGRPTNLRSCGGSGLDCYLSSTCLVDNVPFRDNEAAPITADANPSIVIIGCCATTVVAYPWWVVGFVLIVEDECVCVCIILK